MAQHELVAIYDTEADTPELYLPRWKWRCTCGAISGIWFLSEGGAADDHGRHVDAAPHVPNYRPYGRST